jgi:SAM-dependent methyltransferase
MGVVTNLLKTIVPDVHITATDAASGMIDTVKSRIKTRKHVEAAVVDSRNLADMPDNVLHTLSTFMICLAPEPDRIAQEMYPVTAPAGILGLAVWADPWFSYPSDPWTKACKQLGPRYERPTLMDDSWTDAEQVKSGLRKVGFTDIVLTTERGAWEWNNSDALLKYLFDGGNPGFQPLVDNWKALGRSVDEVRPLCRKMVENQYGQPDGTIKDYVPAYLVTARKPDGH